MSPSEFRSTSDLKVGEVGKNHSLGHNRARRGRWSPRREVHLALSLFARLEALNRRIPAPPQGDVDPLQHDVASPKRVLANMSDEQFAALFNELQSRGDRAKLMRIVFLEAHKKKSALLLSRRSI